MISNKAKMQLHACLTTRSLFLRVFPCDAQWVAGDVPALMGPSRRNVAAVLNRGSRRDVAELKNPLIKNMIRAMTLSKILAIPILYILPILVKFLFHLIAFRVT
jgi:hypothetical protein